MIRQHKKTLILSSLLTLLPILVGLLLWDRFPEQMAIHWGIPGEADGWGSVPFSVFALPLIMLAAQWLCVLATALDKKNQNQSSKVVGVVLWIIPIVSNLCSAMMYALALGAEFSVTNIMLGAMGLMFIFIGNYLPKCKMNSTIGIKVPWTYTSEENWNATHRFGGKVWFTGGLVMMLSAFLPGKFAIWGMLAAIFALVIIPIVYSYLYYRKQKARGDALQTPLKATGKLGKGSIAALVLLLIFVLVVLFAGDLEYTFDDQYLTIDADFYNDLVIDYASIESIEYREGNVDGIRVGGYGSFRLLMGYFENEEFGIHTRYTYYKPDACIVLSWQDRTVVLSGENAAETQAIYQELLERTSAR